MNGLPGEEPGTTDGVAARGFAAASRRISDPEAELVRRAKTRSSQAWTEIYERHYEQLFRYARARVADQATAEDLAATAFTEALKSIDSYQSRGRPLLAWLYRIARNVVNQHFRSLYRKARTDRLADAGAPSSRPSGTSATSTELEAARAGQSAADDPAALAESWDLREAVQRLSGDQREVVILRYFVGLTTPEVAKLLGKQDRAVYSLQARAIKALRRQLT